MNFMKFETEKLAWVNQPSDYRISGSEIMIRTEPGTDLWQRTYYHFRNDNAPVLQIETEEKYFSFVVKTDFADSHHRFDQCGIVMYLDSENWLKASIEYEDEKMLMLISLRTRNVLKAVVEKDKQMSTRILGKNSFYAKAK